jgi:uncharacterized coiled-coil DUF342 family protein
MEPLTMPANTWTEWSRYVVEAIHEIKNQITRIFSELSETRSEVAKLKSECESFTREMNSKLKDETQAKLDNLEAEFNAKLYGPDGLATRQKKLEDRVLIIEVKCAIYGVIAGVIVTFVMQLFFWLINKYF